MHPCERWIGTVVARGSGRVDADILRDAHRAATAGDIEALTAANRRGLAYRATAELALETTAQGMAFLATCRAAWPEPFLDRWAVDLDAVCHPAAVGAATARAGIPLADALRRLSAGDGGQPRFRRPAPRLDWPDRAASASSAHSNRR